MLPTGDLAEGMRFELTVRIDSVRRLSKPLPSATRPPLRREKSPPGRARTQRLPVLFRETPARGQTRTSDSRESWRSGTGRTPRRKRGNRRLEQRLDTASHRRPPPPPRMGNLENAHSLVRDGKVDCFSPDLSWAKHGPAALPLPAARWPDPGFRVSRTASCRSPDRAPRSHIALSVQSGTLAFCFAGNEVADGKLAIQSLIRFLCRAGSRPDGRPGNGGGGSGKTTTSGGASFLEPHGDPDGRNGRPERRRPDGHHAGLFYLAAAAPGEANAPCTPKQA